MALYTCRMTLWIFVWQHTENFVLWDSAACRTWEELMNDDNRDRFQQRQVRLQHTIMLQCTSTLRCRSMLKDDEPHTYTYVATHMHVDNGAFFGNFGSCRSGMPLPTPTRRTTPTSSCCRCPQYSGRGHHRMLAVI